MIYLLILLVLLIAFAVWWLLFESEGVYLGRRIVIRLYDLYAGRYDNIKEFDPEYDHILLAKPIMGAIAPHTAPMVLDVATGTGRLPDALLNHTQFEGAVIGVDLSRAMLHKAAEKFIEDGEQVTFIWAPAERLPFDDNAFDVVTCLEALEFMNNMNIVLDELVRVLRPGGLLLTTNRINTRWMPGKTIPAETFATMLKARGLIAVEIEDWQQDYQRVWATKAGDSSFIGAQPALDLLRCPDGSSVQRGWRCGEQDIPFGDDGVIEMHCL